MRLPTASNEFIICIEQSLFRDRVELPGRTIANCEHPRRRPIQAFEAQRDSGESEILDIDGADVA